MLAGKLANWIDGMDDVDIGDDDNDRGRGAGRGEGRAMDDGNKDESDGNDEGGDPSTMSTKRTAFDARSFEVTLDSILILPHWEVLDAKMDAFERTGGGNTMTQRRGGGGGKGRGGRGRRNRSSSSSLSWYTLESDGDDINDGLLTPTSTSTTTQEYEYRQRREEGRRLIEDEERKGIERKRARERKRIMRIKGEGVGNHDDEYNVNEASMEQSTIDDVSDDGGGGAVDERHKDGRYNGPCVIYLSPNEESRKRLEALRESLRIELFNEYDAYSPASPVSPRPERLPRGRRIDANDAHAAPSYRPLLPIGGFQTVNEAVKVARVMQRSWDPLRFNVTDLQFISRRGDDDYDDEDDNYSARADRCESIGTRKTDMRRVGGEAGSTSGGEVDDVSRRGVYGCDVMVMLRGEEPDEGLMEDEASLSMMMSVDGDDADDADDADDDDDDGGREEMAINYDEVFTTAEREYQRMRAHEESSSPDIIESSSSNDDDEQATTTDIEAWLDDDADDLLHDEGATVVIGRAQFFMGAMREFVG
jgi:hypothetical protein